MRIILNQVWIFMNLVCANEIFLMSHWPITGWDKAQTQNKYTLIILVCPSLLFYKTRGGMTPGREGKSRSLFLYSYPPERSLFAPPCSFFSSTFHRESSSSAIMRVYYGKSMLQPSYWSRALDSDLNSKIMNTTTHMSFLNSVAGLSLKDRMRSSNIWKGSELNQ